MKSGMRLFNRLVKKGSGKFRGPPNRRSPKGQLYHVRGVVDGALVARTWSRRRGWVYEVFHWDAFGFGLYGPGSISYKEHRERLKKEGWT